MTARKISELTIEGLRGCPRLLTLPLRGKSLCLVGENGRGKTTIADAAELWGTGDLAAFHSEGCSLEAAIHLDASAASVTATGSGFSHRRTLGDLGVAELQALGPVEGEIAPIPILRHSTIDAFMSATPGEKKKALLELLGVGSLNALREPLRTTAGHAKRDAEQARRAMAGEAAAVKSQLVGEQLIAYAETRRVTAGLDTPIEDLADLLSLEHAKSAPQPDAAGAVDRLAATLIEVEDDAVGAWNRVVADEALIRAGVNAELLRAAQRAIGPDDRACPVCEQPIVGQELAMRLAERAQALSATRAELSEADQDLGALERTAGAVRTALGALRAAEPGTGFGDEDGLARWDRELVQWLKDVGYARSQRASCPPAPQLQPLREMLPRLRELAGGDSRATQTQALIELAELRQKCLRLAEAERVNEASRTAHEATKRILAIADEEIELAIVTAVERLSSVTADYYARLVHVSPISDVKLVYKRARSGQLEFSLTFDSRHRRLSPPRRIMSTSQLNALGLALHLARLTLDEDHWRTMFLDDVVNSFDASYRQGLARLLVDEFSDWQVVALTHDRAFADILRRTVTGWSFREIIAFTARGGPHLSNGDPRVALRDRLDDGASAMEAAHLARRALEQGLSTPLYKLTYTIRFDPDQRYTAQDYLRALRAGFKRSKSPLKDLAVLKRMDADSYMSNLGVHHRIDSGALTTDDLYRLADDLDELDRALNCGVCEEPVWRTRRSASGGESFQCGCGALAA